MGTPEPGDPPEAPSAPRRAIRWLGWIISAALLGAVITVALHTTEEAEFLRIIQQAEPKWMLLALGLQALTYLFLGDVFRRVIRAARQTVSMGTVYRLSLAKLFIDQAVPSTGLSGTYVLAQGLLQRGISRGAVMAAVVVDLVSYYAAYVLCLAVALIIAIREHHADTLIISIAVVFVFYAIVFSTTLMRLSGRKQGGLPQRVLRWKPLRALAGVPADADNELTHRLRLLGLSLLDQLGIVLADAATLWLLIHALGSEAPFANVFASFMIANLFRTFGIVPGGLGVFEAASVVTLKMAGVPMAIALGATLLFRGLSFWLPMVPGLLFARAAHRSATTSAGPMDDGPFWSKPAQELLELLATTAQGLPAGEAEHRLFIHGRNELTGHLRLTRMRVLLDQLRNPLLLVLFFAALVSAFSGEWTDATIVIVILVASIGVGYAREYQARSAAEALLSRIATRVNVLRAGAMQQVPSAVLVPGDVVLLSAGSLIPADGVVIESTDCFVSEAALTGESFPVEKAAGTCDATTPLAQRRNALFLGSNVRSGSARMLVVHTGGRTAYGAIAKRLEEHPMPTAFERGITRFGYLLTGMMVVLVAVVFTAHMLQGRALIETLLFAIALAVGLSPELLPAILSVNLARGAQLLARKGVLVRRLNAIENLGSMDVLCTDKTGTITEGVMRLEGAFDPAGASSDAVLELGALNATLASGFDNPLDQAIAAAHRPSAINVTKLGEVPFDFTRKRLSVALATPEGPTLIMKGAFHHVLEVCTQLADGTVLDPAGRAALEARYAAWSNIGVRVLALATRPLAHDATIARELETGMAFAGFLTFLDKPKDGVSEAIAGLAAIGVTLKVISGDNRLVTGHMARLVGLPSQSILTGEELQRLEGLAFQEAVLCTDLFAEVDPDQKEHIIRALRAGGRVVGYMGDGVNDAPAMHAADVGLSVEEAVDVAREAADLVLLERDLMVIKRGIEEGRRTFSNTMKYLLTTMSANLGNMLSMAFASLFLPFLPLLAGQILLNNFLSDIPAVGLADDNVDPEDVSHPHRWDIRFIGRFMLEFGLMSSVFDMITFGVLLYVVHATPELFRTGWFVESLLTELVIALVVRTRRPFYRSRPGRLLLNASLVLIVLAFVIPFLPGAGLLGFVPVPGLLLAALAGILMLYVLGTELLKRWFYRGLHNR